MFFSKFSLHFFYNVDCNTHQQLAHFEITSATILDLGSRVLVRKWPIRKIGVSSKRINLLILKTIFCSMIEM